MNTGAAGVNFDLEAIALERCRCAKIAGDIFETRRPGSCEQVTKSPRRVERFRGCGHPGGREARGHDTILCGDARMQRLGHGAELELGAARHAEAQADGSLYRVRVEPHQPRTCRAAGHSANRAGRMPASFIVIQIHAVSDRANHFEAGDIGIQYGFAARLQFLSQRQQCG